MRAPRARLGKVAPLTAVDTIVADSSAPTDVLDEIATLGSPRLVVTSTGG